jgi:hypothetical protein
MTTISPDCVDAEPLRQRLRSLGFEHLSAGFNNPKGETWRHSDTNQIAQLTYCPGTRDSFMQSSVMDALGVG